MKTLYYLFASVCLFLILACQPQSSTSTSTTEESLTEITPKAPNTKDTISYGKFMKWKNAWEKDQWDWMSNDTIYSFSLPVVDLAEVLAEDAAGTRFYLGLEKQANGKPEIKLMLVGTKKNGDDLVDYDNGMYVYDFSTPCPPKCQDDQ